MNLDMKQLQELATGMENASASSPADMAKMMAMMRKVVPDGEAQVPRRPRPANRETRQAEGPRSPSHGIGAREVGAKPKV